MDWIMSTYQWAEAYLILYLDSWLSAVAEVDPPTTKDLELGGGGGGVNFFLYLFFNFFIFFFFKYMIIIYNWELKFFDAGSFNIFLMTHTIGSATAKSVLSLSYQDIVLSMPWLIDKSS